MEIFDSHTHLNDTFYHGKEMEYLDRAKALDVTQIAVVGSDAEMNASALALGKRFENVHPIIGWHPEMAKDYTPEAEQTMIKQLQTPGVVALGEIGLDYHWDTSPHDVQQKVFARQLQIAQDLQLPVSIHTRDAFEDTYQILKAAKLTGPFGIMHSFNGDTQWVEKFLDLGMLISFSGVVSFKNAPIVHESAKQVPLNKLLVETDAPYLTPAPHRGEPNETGYTRFVAEAIAKLRDVPVETIAKATFDNAERIFGLTND